MSAKAALSFAVVCMGISAAAAQLVFMRELMCVFGGNEMVLGVVLGNWLLLGGLGAALGRGAGTLRRPELWMAGGLVLLGVLPAATVLAVRVIPGLVFVRGAGVGLSQTVGACFVALAPYCLLAGWLLTAACAAASRGKGAAALADVYMLDSLGMIAGGLLLTFMLFGVAGHLSIAIGCGLLSIASAALLGAAQRSGAMAGGAVAVGVVLMAAGAIDLDGVSTRAQHPGFAVTASRDTPYGRLVITRSGAQTSFIYNGAPLASTQNAHAAEETAHYAMIQRPDARRVMLVGAAAAGAWAEVRKYGSAQIDIVEMDAALATAVASESGLPAEGVRIIRADARAHLRRAGAAYDVIIVGAGDPDTAAANRYFTREFFRLARSALGSEGVLCFTMGGFESIMPPELADALATVHTTIRGLFGNVMVLPAGRTVVLASQSALSADIGDRLAAAGVPTRFVTPSYVAGMFTPSRMGEVVRALRRDAPVNTDFAPALYLRQLRLWLRRYDVGFGAVEVLAMAALGVYVMQLRRYAAGVFTAGLAGSALEVILLLGFQAAYGSVYQKVGLIVSMFMAGLAAGALVAGMRMHSWGPRHFAAMEIATAALAAATVPVMVAAGGLAGTALDAAGQAVYAILAAAPGLIIGMQVPLAGRLDGGDAARAASRVLAADFVGACLGAVLVCAVLIPLLGMTTVCLLVAGAKLASLAAAWR